MLAHLALAISDSELRARLHQLAQGPDTIVTELPAENWLEVATKLDSDLLVVDGKAIASPIADLESGSEARSTRELITILRTPPSHCEVLVVASDLNAEARAGLVAAGCLAVLSDQLADGSFREALHTLLERRREASQLQRGASDADSDFGDFLSISPGMRKFLQVARKLSRSDSTVLILGETGVGKERLARAIHSQGARAGGPFVVLNCGAVPEALLETELFGHERGAFTGAVRAHRGHFELAHRGTIFVDEIGELPLHLQVKLLRAIQERTIQRIGAENTLPVDVRIVAATNRDLHAEMQEKRFRSDLYYRLSVVSMEVPPLRERREDIPALVDYYFQQFRARIPTIARSVSPEAMQALQNYSWPGNIRELINVVERSVLLCDGERIEPCDFPESITAAALVSATPDPLPAAIDDAITFDDSWLRRTLAESRHSWNSTLERAYLSGLLRNTNGRIGETATRAGIDPRSLYAKMKQYQLRKEDFR